MLSTNALAIILFAFLLVFVKKISLKFHKYLLLSQFYSYSSNLIVPLSLIFNNMFFPSFFLFLDLTPHLDAFNSTSSFLPFFHLAYNSLLNYMSMQHFKFSEFQLNIRQNCERQSHLWYYHQIWSHLPLLYTIRR